MLYKPIENPDKKKKYCECMNKELKNAVGVPLHVKERLSKEYTGNIDIALGLPFDDTKDYPTKKAVESPEGKALITVLGTCTNSTLNKK